MMAVEINLKLEIKTLGTIHSTGERVLFTLENEPNNPKRPILKSFSEVKPPQHDVIDILYFCANDAIQGITFFRTKEGIVQAWSGNLTFKLEPQDYASLVKMGPDLGDRTCR